MRISLKACRLAAYHYRLPVKVYCFLSFVCVKMEIIGKVQKINVLRNYLCILLSSVGPGKPEIRFNVFSRTLKRKWRKLEGCEVSMLIIKWLWYFPSHPSSQFEICCLTSMHIKFNILSLLLLLFQISNTQIYFSYSYCIL